MLENAGRTRRKKDKKPIIVKLLMCLILVALIGAALVRPLLEKWLPSTEQKDIAEWFEVSGDEVRMYLDLSYVAEHKAHVIEGEIYLPYDYAVQTLNQRFYFNTSEELLSYTLPDETIDYEMNDPVGDTASPALTYIDGELNIALSLVELYTDISHKAFISEDTPAKRVFIYHGGGEYSQAISTRELSVRTAADKKAPILTKVSADSAVIVTDIAGSWSRVATDDGFIGYAYNDYLSPTSDKRQIASTYREPDELHVRLDEKVVLGWHTMYSADANSLLTGYYERSGGVLNVVCPQWLQITDADGSLLDLSSSSYVETAHKLGLKVWASVDNVNQPGGIEDFSTAEFFSDTVKRRDFIARLIDKALKYGYDGLNLDFESIPSQAGPHFTQFFRELAVECHKVGVTLSIDNPVPYNYNSYYSLSEQSVFADYVIIMAYDEHYEGGEPGPIASSTYTGYAISASLSRGVSEEALIVGVPFYTRLWRTTDDATTSESLGMAESETYVRNHGITLEFDDALGLNYGSKTEGSTLLEIWVEDDTSIALKADLARAYDIAGIAAWRLGIESTDVWQAMDLNDEN